MAHYELWDVKTRNLVGSYASESEALDVVRRTVDAYGRAHVAEMALVRENTRGRSKTLAMGAELAERALGAASPGERMAVRA